MLAKAVIPIGNVIRKLDERRAEEVLRSLPAPWCSLQRANAPFPTFPVWTEPGTDPDSKSLSSSHAAPSPVSCERQLLLMFLPTSPTRGWARWNHGPKKLSSSFSRGRAPASESLVYRLIRRVQNGQASQSQKTDEFSTLYICIRKGVVCWPVLQSDELSVLCIRLALATDTRTSL